ncbi:MAG: hypothetical protein KKA67_09620 [Spirochaetes bacterium]|nr:hypothetical protein [Spirochaetota bacterium]MBU1079929.1 hypothetical protein [Spirochaetota bacterium]
MKDSRRRLPVALAISMALVRSLAPGIAWADFNVELTAPELKPGMESLEAILQAQAEGFADDIVALVEQTLDKPLFMRAFAGAAVTASFLSGLTEASDGSPGSGGLALSIGSAASVWSADFSPAALERLSVLGPDDDVEAGACVQPLVAQAALSLARLAPGLDAGAYVGLMDAQGGELGVRSFSAGLSAGLSLFQPPAGDRPPMLRWRGLRLSLGAGYSYGAYSALVEPGPIYQSIPIDPDGEGPLVPLSTTIQVDPSVTAGVLCTALGGRLGATTGITLFGTLSLAVGAGFGVSYGASQVSLESSDAIQVLGYLSSLVENDGSIALSGTTEAVESVEVSPYLSAGLGFRVGAFSLVAPFVWNVPKGLGLAIFVEFRP